MHMNWALAVHRRAIRLLWPFAKDARGSRMADQTAQYDVIVAGCGPVGAMAANLLGRANLRTLVVEREQEPNSQPRAVHIDHEIMRLFQSVGLSAELLPLFRVGQGHIHIGADGGVIRYLGTAGLHSKFGWANDYFFYQPELESVLRAGLARFPHVEARFGTSLTGIQQHETHVSATLSDGREVTARHVIACDGASSPTRKLLGLDLIDLDFDEPWLVVDAEMSGPIRYPGFSGVPEGADLQNLSVMLCDPKRPSTIVPGRGKHRRWEFMLLPGETESEMMRPEQVSRLLEPWIADAPCRLIRAATYRFHGLIAERWKSGQVYLAGDAAHQTPPFFGQGMCHGMRDVANLAWKMALVRSGAAPTSLLESYQAERDPHVRAVVNAAIAAGKYICQLDPTAAKKRDEELRKLLGKPRPASAGDLIPAIAAGIVKDRGERFIQPTVGFAGRRMLLDDATGGGFVLIGKTASVIDALTDETRKRWAALGGRAYVLEADNRYPQLQDSDGDLRQWLDAKGAVAVLIRPDFYVFGTVASAPEVDALVRDLAHKIAPG
jgi:3-(3-hydroxy-phenyl)propionate hydroxylase